MTDQAKPVDISALISSVTITGVSRFELAKATGVNPSTITRLAEGDIRNPSYGVVTRLIAASERFAHTQKNR